MKRQLRPYTVETKSSRPRPANASASRPAPAAVAPFPEALPVRDVHEDLGQGTRDETSTKSKALLEAERMFKGLMTFPSAEPSTALTQSPVLCDKEVSATRVSIPAASADLLEARSPEAEERRPRVLPDLSQEARQKEPPSPAEPTRPARVKRSTSHPGQPRARRPRKEHAAEVAGSLSSAPAPQGLPSPASPPSLPPGLAPAVVASLAGAGAPKQPRRLWSRELPRGERWKTRRLPRVCWANLGRRRSL